MSSASRNSGYTARELTMMMSAVAAIGWLALNSTPPAQHPQRVPSYPEYPRKNLAICYHADPDWPQRPPGVTWGPVTGVAVDAEDAVWICTEGRPPVQCYGPDGRYLGGWGGGLLKDPHQLRIDTGGAIWVVDAGLHVVRQFTVDGHLIRSLGTAGEPGEDAGHFNTPTDVAIGPQGGIFVSDGYRNSRVVHFAPDGSYLNAWGGLGSGAGELSLPHSIVADRSGRLYVAERANGRVQIFDSSGRPEDQWRSLVVPWGLGLSRAGGIWVCGSSPAAWREGEIALATPPRDQLLIRFDEQGRALQQWYLEKATGGSCGPGQFDWIHCIAEDSRGNLYCGDVQANRVQKLVRDSGLKVSEAAGVEGG